MAGEIVSINAADGGSFNAYIARPETGRGPGLVVIQEIFGVNDHIRALCGLYAPNSSICSSACLAPSRTSSASAIS